jgi:hypothetical protein
MFDRMDESSRGGTDVRFLGWTALDWAFVVGIIGYIDLVWMPIENQRPARPFDFFQVALAASVLVVVRWIRVALLDRRR